jgi:uncharacterized protein
MRVSISSPFIYFWYCLFATAFLVLVPHFASLPFYLYALVCFFFILLALRLEKQGLSDIGLKKRGLTVKVILVGIVSAILLNRFISWGYYPIIRHFFGFDISSYTEYDFVRKSPLIFSIILLTSWVVGGFYEELAFRGFIHSRIQRLTTKWPHSFWIAAVCSSIIFGIYHWQQGIFGIVHATIAGFCWVLLVRHFKGNLWYAIISHAAYDTITLTLIYFGVLGY